MPKTITLKEARAVYALTLDASQIGQGPIFVEHEGKVVAVILSLEEYQGRFARDFDVWCQEQLQHLEPNLSAFERMLPELLKTHLRQWVAIYQERLVDTDVERAALVERIRVHGYRPVYIDQVTPEPRIVELSSPEEAWRV